MKMKKEIIILVGNIGSGKSTFIKAFTKLDSHNVIARDALRYMIGGGEYRFDFDIEPIIWKSEKQILINFLKQDFPVIVDEVGVSKKMRKRYVELAKKYNYRIVCFVLPRLSKKESVDRRLKNPHGQPNRELWERVWDKFDKQYQEPSLKEGFKKIIKLKI